MTPARAYVEPPEESPDGSLLVGLFFALTFSAPVWWVLWRLIA